MPVWIAKRATAAAWRHLPWRTVLAIAVWLARKGQERLKENLTRREREELLNLVKRSKGRPSSLPQRDRTRLKNIAGKAIRG
jgi:hypothetical protein